MKVLPIDEMYTTDIFVVMAIILIFVIKEVLSSTSMKMKIKKKFKTLVTEEDGKPRFNINIERNLVIFKIILFFYAFVHLILTLFVKFHMISLLDFRQLTLPFSIFLIGSILSYFLQKRHNNKKELNAQTNEVPAPESDETKTKNEPKKEKNKFMKRILTIALCLTIQNTGITFSLIIVNNLPYSQNLELFSIFSNLPLWFVLLGIGINYLKERFELKVKSGENNLKKNSNGDENSEFLPKESTN